MPRKYYCVLSREETGRLENYGIWPTCKFHRHISEEEALALCADDTHRAVGGHGTRIEAAGTVTMIVPCIGGRQWKPNPCHTEDGTLLIGMRTWGLAPTQ